MSRAMIPCHDPARATGHQGSRSRRKFAAVVFAALSLTGLALAGCGGSSSSGGEGGIDQINAAWIWYGPKDDGGWNTAQVSGQDAVQQELGDSVTQKDADNVPYTNAAAQTFEQFVTTAGSNVLVDTVGYGKIFTGVCDMHPSIYCIQANPFTKLGKNTTGWTTKYWLEEYTAGVAAGLSTKTNTVGIVLGFKIPSLITAANSYAMGCRAVNPQCQVRVVVTNDYYSPPKTDQAASTLVNAGADVVRAFVDYQSYCQPLKAQGALAIGNFSSNAKQCGDSALVSTIWDQSDYYVNEFKSIQDRTFNSKQLQYLDPKTSLRLEGWGPTVPQSVRSKVEQTFGDLVSGKENPFVGPIKDASGKVRIPPGKKLSNSFLYGGWKWYVDGIVAH